MATTGEGIGAPTTADIKQTEIVPGGSARREADTGAGSLLFIGTATTLIRYGGFTILTDPNFLHKGETVGIGYGTVRSKRLTEPALDIDDLPPLDLVVLSHCHEDHFDRVVERRLNKRVPIVTTPEAATALGSKGFRETRPLNTWDQVCFVKDPWTLTVTSLPGKHGPEPVNRFLPSVMGSMLEFRRVDSSASLKLYVSGDTLIHERLHEIPRRYPRIDMGLFHLGGTRVFGLTLTMDGKQGAEAVRIIAPDVAVPIHYDDYDVFKSPLEDFKREVRAAGLEGKVRYVARGERISLPSLDGRGR
jgi:L-ascorbate metabolism protein UlaG (beta-lactamase superfamily)